MRFLDFQYVTSGSPVYDLAYSIYSGTSKDILDNLDFYLKIYYNKFSSTLKTLGCDAQKTYPFEKFKQEWKQYCKFGFMMSLPIWRIKFVDKNHIPSVEESNEGSSDDKESPKIAKVADDKVELHKQRIIELMTHLYENGFL